MGARRIGRGLFLAGAGLVFGLLLVEVGLRLVAPLLQPPMRWVIADEAARMHYVKERTSRGRLLVTNLPAADLLAVGDSFVFGSMVPEDLGWVGRLAVLAPLRAVNLAVPATGPWEYNQMLRLGLQTRPRVILYGVFADDILASVRPAPPGGLWLRHADLVRDPVAYLSHTIQVSLSRALSLQIVKYLLYQPTKRHAPYRFESGNLSFMFSGVEYWRRMLDPGDPTIQTGLDRLEQAVAEADQSAKAADATLLVVLIPNKEMVYIPILHSQGLLASDVAARLWSSRFDQPLDTIKLRLVQRRIRTLDLREGFRRIAARGTPLYFRVDGHWNEAGNDLAARLVAEYLGQHRDALLGRGN